MELKSEFSSPLDLKTLAHFKRMHSFSLARISVYPPTAYSDLWLSDRAVMFSAVPAKNITHTLSWRLTFHLIQEGCIVTYILLEPAAAFKESNLSIYTRTSAGFFVSTKNGLSAISSCPVPAPFAPISSQNLPKLPLEKAGKTRKNGVKSGKLTKTKGLTDFSISPWIY